MLITEIENTLPLIDDLEGWDEFPENYYEEEEEYDSESVIENDNSESEQV